MIEKAVLEHKPDSPARQAPHRYRNFDTIRFWAAASVLFSHSFLIATDSADTEPFKYLTGDILGGYGVEVFFILSGFLVTQSWFSSSSTGSYAWKRFLRIYPAYAASILLLPLVVAPFFSTIPVSELLLAPDTWRAIVNGLYFNYEGYYLLPVEFYPDSRLSGDLNGVLWTLQAEVLLYSCVALLGVLRLLRMGVVLGIAVLFFALNARGEFIYINLFDLLYLNWWALSLAIPGFFAGSFCFFLFRRHRPSGKIALGLIAAFALLQFVDLAAVFGDQFRRIDLFGLLIAYPLLWLGYGSAPKFPNMARWGDLSYGLYLFGWPVQQVVRHFTGAGWNGWTFFLVCFPIAVAVALVSWNLIEKPAMALRKWNPAASLRTLTRREAPSPPP